MSLYSMQLKIKEGKIRLLGQIDVSNDEYDELIIILNKYIRNMDMQQRVKSNIYISMALVQIAIRYFKEGRYWDCFEELGINASSAKKHYLGEVFLETLKEYGLFIIDSDVSYMQIVENIKAHTFIPNEYMDDYFLFLFSFYDKNLFRQLDDQIENEIEGLKACINENLVRNNSLKLAKIGTNSVKTYRLLNATKFVIAQNDANFIQNLIMPHLKLLDSYYYDDLLPKTEDRYSRGFIKWINDKENEEILERNKFKSKHNHFSRRPYFVFNEQTNKSQLIIPEQKFIQEDILSNNAIFINNKKYQFDLYRTFGGIASEVITINEVNPFKNYSIEIPATSHNFNIPQKNYRIFDSEWIEIPKIKKGICNILVKSESKVKISNGETIYEDLQKDIMKYQVIVHEKTCIYIDDKVESISGEFKEEYIFNYIFKEYEVYKDMKLEQKLQSCYKHPVLRLNLEEHVINGCILSCNNKKFKLSEIANIYDTDYKTKNIEIYLHNFLENEDGLYEIYLSEPAKTKRHLVSYVLISKLKFHTDKSIYIYSNQAKIEVENGYNLEGINCTSENNTIFTFNLNEKYSIAIFKLKLRDRIFFISLSVKVFKYYLNKQWNIERPEYIWYDDLENELYFKIPGITRANLFFYKKNKLTGISQNNSVFKFDITSFRHEIEDKNLKKVKLFLEFYDEKRRYEESIDILKENWINKIRLIKDGSDTSVKLEVDFLGKNVLCIDIKENVSENCIISKKEISNGLNDMPELDFKQLYKMCIYDLISDEFGFGEEYKYKFTIRKIGAIDYQDISNCNLYIKGIIHENVNLKFNREYMIFNLIKIDNNKYKGKIKYKIHQYNKKRNFWNQSATDIKSIILDIKNGDMFIEAYSKDAGNWCDIWYDSEQKILIEPDNDLLYESFSKHRDRLSSLNEENTQFNIDIRREYR